MQKVDVNLACKYLTYSSHRELSTEENHLSSDSSKGSAFSQNRKESVKCPFPRGGLKHTVAGGLLTDDADLPDFDKGALDLLDAGQTLVQVGPEHVVALWVTFCDGGKDPATT